MNWAYRQKVKWEAKRELQQEWEKEKELIFYEAGFLEGWEAAGGEVGGEAWNRARAKRHWKPELAEDD